MENNVIVVYLVEQSQHFTCQEWGK